MNRTQVYEIIDSERDWQDRKWGTIEQHPHEVGGWLTVLRQLLWTAENEWAHSPSDVTTLDQVRKIAAVSVACIEQHDCRERYAHGEMEHMRT